MKKIRILLTGGGSGGHMYPLVAVVHQIQAIAQEHGFDLDMRYFGPRDAFVPLIEQAGVRVVSIVGGKMRRYASLQNIIDIPKFFIGLLEALIKIFFFMPDVAFSKGGTGALPVVFASWFYRVPVVIHESDAIPGLTNIFSSKFARRIAVSFQNAINYFHPQKTAVTGNPVREDLLPPYVDQAVAKESLGFDPQKPLILILGGSQGSRRINEFVVLNIPTLISFAQILHQTGVQNIDVVRKLALVSSEKMKEEERLTYRPVPYLEGKDIKNALIAADIIISRAGSGSIFEAALIGKPVILIPLEGAANDHQRANAYAFAEIGAAVVVEEENLSIQIISLHLKKILEDRAVKEKMISSAHAFAMPDAAKMIAQEVLNLV